jgi:hypothetical protein
VERQSAKVPLTSSGTAAAENTRMTKTRRWLLGASLAIAGCVDGSIGDATDVAESAPGEPEGFPASEDAGPASEDAPAEDTAKPEVPRDSSGHPADDGAPDTKRLSADLAQHLRIRKISAYQSIEVPLARDGEHATRSRWENIWGVEAAQVPLVAGREALVRIFVEPEDGFEKSLVTARIKLQAGGKTQILYGNKEVSAASSDGDLDSTINVVVPAEALAEGTKFGVVLNGPQPSEAPSNKSSARFPEDGTLDDLGVDVGGDVMKVVLVPMRYQGRMPDTSDAQVETYRDHLLRRYPVTRVEVSVHDAIDYTGTITHDDGIGDMLEKISALHGKDSAASNVYYVGLLKPADKFWDFCGSGCVAGLSYVGEPASVWWGYSGTDWAGGTGAHELGHAHGLPHAPCGVDGSGFWPNDEAHANAKLGAWGWDPVEKKLVDPGNTAKTVHDLMSYCGPSWIGDFNYAKLWRRVKKDNTKASIIGAMPLHETVRVAADGSLSWSPTPRAWEAWMDEGELRTIAIVDATGKSSTVTARWFAYDHLPGGHFVFPTAADAREVRFAGRSVTR